LKRTKRWILVSLTVAVVVGLVHWLDVINEPGGCPPELLRHYLQQDRVLGRPVQVAEQYRNFGPGHVASRTVTTFTPAGEPLQRICRSVTNPPTVFYDTTYSYNRCGWLVGATIESAQDNPSALGYSYLYVPETRKIEIAASLRLPPGSPASGPGVTVPNSLNLLDRIKCYIHAPTVVHTDPSVIRLDRRNRYVDMVEFHAGRMLYRKTFQYDEAGHVIREICLWPSMRVLHPSMYRYSSVYKRDARGNVVEQRNFDTNGKLDLRGGIILNAYKYDRVGNWVEKRITVFSPGKKKRTLASITTRTITYR
jgi:hypothetical protein